MCLIGEGGWGKKKDVVVTVLSAEPCQEGRRPSRTRLVCHEQRFHAESGWAEIERVNTQFLNSFTRGFATTPDPEASLGRNRTG